MCTLEKADYYFYIGVTKEPTMHAIVLCTVAGVWYLLLRLISLTSDGLF